MKKTLDALLREAFEAGRKRGEDETLLVERGCFGDSLTVLDFDEWRAGLTA